MLIATLDSQTHIGLEAGFCLFKNKKLQFHTILLFRIALEKNKFCF